MEVVILIIGMVLGLLGLGFWKSKKVKDIEKEIKNLNEEMKKEKEEINKIPDSELGPKLDDVFDRRKDK